MLDYLVHNCYTNSARAFVRDSAMKHLDLDGDETMSSPVKDFSTELYELEGSLAIDEQRKGAVLSLPFRIAYTYPTPRNSDEYPDRQD